MPPGWASGAERWLGRVGVVFVVLALGFLFKYSFDQGWITPAFRLALGALTGMALLLVGLRLEGERARYGEALLGGAIFVFYLVGFAAFQLYHLVGFAASFSVMASTTLLAFVLSVRQRFVSLATLGVGGGLATPFLLYTGASNVPGLVMYTAVVVSGAGAIYLRRGWRSLQLVSALGGMAVMAVAVDQSTLSSRWITLLGIGVVWAQASMAPLLRHWLGTGDPGRWAPAPLGRLAVVFGVGFEQLDATLLRVWSYGGALGAVSLVAVLFGMDLRTAGGLTIAAALLHVVLAWRMARVKVVRDVLLEAVTIMMGVGAWMNIQERWAILPLAVIAASAHLVARAWSARGVGAIAHCLFIALAAWFLKGEPGSGLTVGRSDPWSFTAFAQLASLGVALASSFVLVRRPQASLYRVAVHLAFLIWLAAEVRGFEHGRGLVTLVWGVYGLLLLIPAIGLKWRPLQLVGLGTLGLVAGKLVMFDMAQLDPIWRIGLFMAFGVAFMGVGYLINREASE